jgi:cysteinyl-tRNA synthetase
MSKSLGNFLTIREVLENYSPETLRLFAFSSHYRTPLDFSDAAMQEAAAGLDRLYNCLAEIQQLPETGTDSPAKSSKKDVQKIGSIGKRFCDAMDNDFNTAQALGILFDAAKTLNRIRQGLPANPSKADLELLRDGTSSLQRHADILGLLRDNPASYVNSRKKAILEALDMDEHALFKLIDERDAARAAKDWARADAIRDELLAKGIEIKDSAEGTTWSVRS